MFNSTLYDNQSEWRNSLHGSLWRRSHIIGRIVDKSQRRCQSYWCGKILSTTLWQRNVLRNDVNDVGNIILDRCHIDVLLHCHSTCIVMSILWCDSNACDSFISTCKLYQDGNTALITAASGGHTSLVALLLDGKANTNIANNVRHYGWITASILIINSSYDWLINTHHNWLKSVNNISTYHLEVHLIRLTSIWFDTVQTKLGWSNGSFTSADR